MVRECGLQLLTNGQLDDGKQESGCSYSRKYHSHKQKSDTLKDSKTGIRRPIERVLQC
jgi:hypothetical protein